MLFLVKAGEFQMYTEPNITPAAEEEDIAANEECTMPSQEEDATQHDMAPLISGPIQKYHDNSLNNWGYKRFS